MKGLKIKHSELKTLIREVIEESSKTIYSEDPTTIVTIVTTGEDEFSQVIKNMQRKNIEVVSYDFDEGTLEFDNNHDGNKALKFLGDHDFSYTYDRH